jgi:mRNA-degrading endonuclease RelE of RelBE toxin-antitoxin system
MYEIEFSPRARKDLDWFKKREQNEILDGIESSLTYEPNVETRHRKKLRPNETAEWELRLGKYRVFYDVEETVLIVSIEAIGLKLGNTFYFQGKEEEL